MTKLDAVLERIRKLPQDRQDAIAADLEFILEDEASGPTLSDAQWADVRRRAQEEQGALIPHEAIVAEFEPKFRE